MGFLTGAHVAPDDTESPTFHQLYTENLMVSSWLINAMAPEIKRSFMFLPTACEIWEAVRDSYSDGEDLARLFELKSTIWQLKQGDREVTSYWLELTALWQELDHLSTEEWSCAHDAVWYKEKIEKERVFQFLAGLNKDLDDVRNRILIRNPLPSTQEVFSEVRREASRRKIMLQEASLVLTSDSSALFSRSNGTGKGQKGKVICEHCKKPGHSKDVCWEIHGKIVICDYCKKPGHNKDACWDIHGKPEDWKPRKGKPKGYQTS
ncbi:hypothetical protein L6164_013045 [Bauhinia variegata]|uniref:Uncharacterized protein n=1 Tax=Bauhinia variegata TaxID=167791 RepID=A0ACB9PD48_BAUVA|nr:hypothetical protein L6164_013045 [Bauhinia variegata]